MKTRALWKKAANAMHAAIFRQANDIEGTDLNSGVQAGGLIPMRFQDEPNSLVL